MDIGDELLLSPSPLRQHPIQRRQGFLPSLEDSLFQSPSLQQTNNQVDGEGVASETHHGRGEISVVVFNSKMIFSIAVRVASEDTPDGGRMLDIDRTRLRSLVRRLPGRGLTPIEVSTPAEENNPAPQHPDISAVLEPVQLQLNRCEF